MIDRPEFKVFLAKLTVLCREYGIELRSEFSPAAIEMAEIKRSWIYTAMRSCYSPSEEWDSLCLDSQEYIKQRKADLVDNELCVADEHYIKILEAGLE